MAISNLYEHTTGKRVISGVDALLHLPHELSTGNVKNPIILTDNIYKIVGLPFFKKIRSHLDNSGYTHAYYDGISMDAPVEIAEEIATLYRDCGCDGIVAVGGGSVIDCAKAVNLMVSKGYDNLDSAMGMDHIGGVMHPFIAVPTTSGTGSEATKIAVVSDTKKNLKIEIITEKIIPSVAILDPDATVTLPPKVTASTAIDALTHAIEALYSLQSNPISRTESFAAIELIVNNVERAVDNPKDKDAGLALANGSYLAGVAFSNSMVGAVHAIGHAAGAVCHVPHGDIMTVLLPHVLRANMESIEDILGELLYWFKGVEVCATTDSNNRAKATIEAVTGLIGRLHNSCNLPETLTDLKITRDSFKSITEKALNDGASMTNPIPMTEEFVLNVLEQAI